MRFTMRKYKSAVAAFLFAVSLGAAPAVAQDSDDRLAALLE